MLCDNLACHGTVWGRAEAMYHGLGIWASIPRQIADFRIMPNISWTWTRCPSTRHKGGLGGISAAATAASAVCPIFRLCTPGERQGRMRHIVIYTP